MQYVVFTCLIIGFLSALGAKWEIRFRIALPWSILMAAAGIALLFTLDRFTPVQSALLQVLAALALGTAVTAGTILFLFYRDPDRTAPTGDNLIISPADGRVIYVREISGEEFPFAVKGGRRIPLAEFTGARFLSGKGWQIGIMMSYLDVHVNRSPLKGRVARVQRIPGRFFSLKHIESLLENERVFTVIENDSIDLGIVQIASRLVRKIVPFIAEGDRLSAGQKLGVIHFGSQVDVIITHRDSLDIVARPSDQVRAGVTILATY